VTCQYRQHVARGAYARAVARPRRSDDATDRGTALGSSHAHNSLGPHAARPQPLLPRARLRMASGCLPLGGRVRAAAPAGALARRACNDAPWVFAPAPGDDSDTEGSECREEPPARQAFDVRACAPADVRPAARRTAHDEGAAAEMGALLRGLAADAAHGAPPQQRLLAVCRIVLAHAASWLKPARGVSDGALAMPGAMSDARRCTRCARC
jgi:hypothetical protein